MRENTFTKADRLIKPTEFARVRRKGRRYSTRSFVLFVLPNGLERTRLGLSVSARVGPSVTRNRIKRLLREYFRTNRGAGGGEKGAKEISGAEAASGVKAAGGTKRAFPPGVDVLITVKRGAEVKDLSQVASEIGSLGLGENPPGGSSNTRQ